MKIEIDYMTRAYLANMHRRRALELRRLAAGRSNSGTKQELESEAGWCESQAERFDAASDVAPEAVPVTPTVNRDLSYLDDTGGSAQ